jgi:hypothetical protein
MVAAPPQVSPIPTLERFRLDPWTPLSHKQIIGDGVYQPPAAYAPSWVDGENRRRLNAYMVLQAYLDNASRHFLAVQDVETRNEQREYGDAALVVASVRASLLGDDQQIIVDGAADYDPKLGKDKPKPEPIVQPPPAPTPPVPPAPPGAPQPPAPQPPAPTGLLGPDGQPLAPSTPPGPTAEELADNEEAKVLAEREDWLRQWAKDERLGLKMLDAERKAIGLGDAVLRLTWSTRKSRPRLHVYDPGFYFPVFDDRTDDEEFPNRIHLAWEIVEDETSGAQQSAQPGLPEVTRGPQRRRVRRITYELVQLPDGQTRKYPWQDPDEPDSDVTCYMTDAIWTLPDNGAPSPDDFIEGTAEYQVNEDGVEVRQLDLMIDFIPVVHMPNTVAGSEHFGRSVISTVLQLLDDIQNADTDLAAASGLTGTPPIWVSGLAAGGSINTYGPGSVWSLGPEGKAGAVDTSGALTALMEYIQFLLHRLRSNSRVTDAALGELEEVHSTSGVHLALMFTTLMTLIQEMRLVRDEKYPLLLKFVQRMCMVGRKADGSPVLEPAEVPPATVEFGSFIPVDKSAAVEHVTALYGAHLISLQTAVEMLMAAGFAIEDASEEVERIQREDFATANLMLEATGDEQAVRERLGLVGPGPRLPSVLNRFAGPGGGPQPPEPGGGTGGGGGAPGEPAPTEPPNRQPTAQPGG